MSKWYPFHVCYYGRVFTPANPNFSYRPAQDRGFDTRKEAIDWLRGDFQACTTSRTTSKAFLVEDPGVLSGVGPVRLKRIKFVKKAKPASRWRPTWIATDQNAFWPAGKVDERDNLAFLTKKEALSYAERNCAYPYWRPGTPKEVK